MALYIVLAVLALLGISYGCTCGLFHLSLYTSTPGAAVTDADSPAATDPAVTIVNGHPIFPVPIQVTFGYSGLAIVQTRAKLTTPKIRCFNNVNLRPIDVAAATPATRPPLVEYFHHPLSLNPIDENQVLVTTSALAATPIYTVIGFHDGNFNVAQGDMYTIHATCAGVSAAAAWSTQPIVLDQPLPAGRYQIIGYDSYATTNLFSRIVFPNQVWRPGCLSGATVAFINSRYIRWGRLGAWGEFETFALPQVDIWNSAGGTNAMDITFDLVRVA